VIEMEAKIRTSRRNGGRTGKPALVVMGVAGCGKTAVGTALAEAIGARYIEGDRLHPPDNVERMARGEPLTDALRASWLDAVGQAVRAAVMGGEGAVAACSALKRIYRDRLRRAEPSIVFVHLLLSRQEAFRRVSNRRGHFMPASLVDNQFAILEPPSSDERAFSVNAERPIEEIVSAVLEFLAIERLKSAE
jgi:gluconokinase